MWFQIAIAKCLCTFLSIALCFGAENGDRSFFCSDGRKIIEGTNHGFISDGVGEYRENFHCEWLIKASDRSFISLTVINVQTECLYDYLYIYDGDSYSSSKLLAAICGGLERPFNVTSTSSKMLIMLFSDANFVQKGFDAEFFIYPCPHNCNNRGRCANDEGVCHCNDKYSGKSCEFDTCLAVEDKCANGGSCNRVSDNVTRCDCVAGYSGDTCEFRTSAKQSSLEVQWKLLSENNFERRAAHNMIFVKEMNKLFIFNGHDLNLVLADISTFDIGSNSWTVTSGANINPRWAAAAAEVPFGFAYYGGWTSYKSDATISDELVVYNSILMIWARPTFDCPGNQCSNPPGLVYHSLTSVDAATLYIIGGLSNNFQYNEMIFKYDIGLNYWTTVVPRNYPGLETRRLGHTTVYDKSGNRLIVYGGFTPRTLRASQTSDTLLMFDIEREMWIVLKERNNNNWPIGRAFHTASLISTYMLVFGGTTGVSDTNSTEMCISHQIWIFNLCNNKWITLSANKANQLDISNRFGHSSIAIGDNVLICGGHNGVVHNDIYSLQVPSQNETQMLCNNRTETECSFFESCIWCNSICTRDFSVCKPNDDKRRSCAEIMCSTLRYFDECQNAFGGQCVWCHSTHSCSDSLSYTGDSSISQWEKNGVLVVHFRPPVNEMQPNYVSIHENFNVTFQYKLSFASEKLLVGFGGVYVVKSYGIFEPKLSAAFKSSNTNALTLKAWRLSSLLVWLDIKPVTSATKQPFNFSSIEEERTFALVSPNSASTAERYYIVVEATYKITFTPGNLTSGFVIKFNDEDIGGRSIQPYFYNANECSRLNNCQLCMTNGSCVWSTTQMTCLVKSSTTNSDTLFVLIPEFCPQCSDSIDCGSCLKHPGCGWLMTEHVCIRQNAAFDKVVTDQTKCPNSCFARKSCESCIGITDDCVWCKTSRTCFPFNLYRVLFPYGKCNDWVDGLSNGANVINVADRCSTCSMRKTCKDCIKSFKCGSCYSTVDPGLAICAAGDFSNETCILEPSISDVSRRWSYSSCLPVDECFIYAYKCHRDAVCNNTESGYKCVCKSGYSGDGIERCEKTCVPSCLHGSCSGSPFYNCQCDLGWTGVDCSVDCQCNGHSWCSSDVGHCDQCYNNTYGSRCEFCIPGTFGNASSHAGCQICNCNGHGNVSTGVCTSETGQCFCTAETEGPNCQFCRHGYFGDARNNGTCFVKCSGQFILTSNVNQTGGFGLNEHLDLNEDLTCIWILSSPHASTPLEVFIEYANDFDCFFDELKVYDGLPPFAKANLEWEPPFQVSTRLLANIKCLANISHQKSLTYTASTGTMTVVYSGGGGDKYSPKFTAYYWPVKCPSNCVGQRNCVDNVCQCKEGLFGAQCDLKCSEVVCDNQKCVSGGNNCGQSLNTMNKVVEVAVTSIKNEELLSSLSDVSIVANDGENAVFICGRSKTDPLSTAVVRVNFNDNSATLVTTFSKKSFAKSTSLIAKQIDKGFYMYDTSSNNGKVEFTFFNYSTSKFRQLPTSLNETEEPLPNLFGYTATTTLEGLCIIGGYSIEFGFNTEIFFYSFEREHWSVIISSGQISIPSIFGHCSTYSEIDKSIYTFGGYVFNGVEVEVSNTLYIFNIEDKVWKLVPSRKANPSFVQPAYSLFPACRIVNDYLVVVHPIDNVHRWKATKVQTFNLNSRIWNKVPSTMFQLTSTDGTISDLSFFDWQASTSYQASKIVFLETETWHLYSFTFPNDSCTVTSGDCSIKGCSSCHSSQNLDVCFDAKKGVSSYCQKDVNGGEVILTSIQSDVVYRDEFECFLRKSCSECLSMQDSQCQWCDEICNEGFCIPATGNCTQRMTCDFPPKPLTHTTDCSEDSCLFYDCSTCVSAHISSRGDVECIWNDPTLDRDVDVMNHLKFRRRCVKADINFVMETAISKVESCPKSCATYQTCAECLNNNENGECYWLDKSEKCFHSVAVPLLSAVGMRSDIRRTRCSPTEFAPSCHDCLKRKNGIWCSASNTNGDGYCTVFSETDNSALCQADHFNSSISKGPFRSIGFLCPPENNCANGHHDCDHETETCIDLVDGFNCICKQGYERNVNGCMPICHGGCNHGVCIKPDICQCDFGFTGSTCQMACNCNGHSNCPGPNDLNICLKCYNNTIGSSCQFCLPGFIADGKQCLTCEEYCNFHSSSCLNVTGLTQYTTTSGSEGFVQQLNSPSIVCQNCAHFTSGPSCGECLPGHFRPPYSIKHDSCMPCRCNGHGINNYCDPETGTNCICSNNTATPLARCLKEDCYKIQCSSCKEYFRGSPANGKACYREIADGGEDYCFTPLDPGHCIQMEELYLEYGQMAFYVMFPDFSNVDVRIIIDVTMGAADVFISTDDIFVGDHHLAQSFVKGVFSEEVRFSSSVKGLVSLSATHEITNSTTIVVETCDSVNSVFWYSTNVRLLWLRNLTQRASVVATTNDFNLQQTQFYVIIQSRAAKTSGNLLYMQDQARFELYIFLTVFCASFVLVIAVFILVWQVKFTRHQNRIRHDETLQIVQLSNRPLARYSVIFDHYEEDEAAYEPCCVQYLKQCQAAVSTFIVVLPGGQSNPNQLGFASALTVGGDKSESEEEDHDLTVSSNNVGKVTRRIFTLSSRQIHPTTAVPMVRV